jgi:hypothetical protein
VNNLFSSILDTCDVREHVSDVINTTANGLQLPETGSLIPIGKPIYPIYFTEILSNKTLSLQIILEMRYIGIPHIQNQSSEKINEPINTSLNQLDEYLPESIWMKDENLLLRYASSYSIYKSDFRTFLESLGAHRKGATYQAINTM